jgi:hypothetical protein
MMSNYERALNLLNGSQTGREAVMMQANAFATLALVDQMVKQSGTAGMLPAEPVRRGEKEFLPGDMVRITLPKTDLRLYNDFSGRHGIVVYGPDDRVNPGWQVSCATGTLRCVASELHMMTRREDRSWPN